MKSRVPPVGFDADPMLDGTGQRPADMPLGQWLNSRMAAPDDMAAPRSSAPRRAMPTRESDDIAAIHRQLDGITAQIEKLSLRRTASTPPPYDFPTEPPAPMRQAAPPPPDRSGLADRLNEAISRLDKRLAGMAQPQPPDLAAKRRTEAVDRAAAHLYNKDTWHTSPPLSPIGRFDSAVAEISARHRQLDSAPAAALSPRPAPAYRPTPEPPAPLPNLTHLEKQLHLITAQIETLRRPDDIDQSIAAFRTELADIRRTLTEAMPRKAIESLENEIRSVARRIDQGRQNGIDSTSLAGIERALGDIYGVLRTLMPAEQLAGFDTAIRNLSAKVDLIISNSPDSSAIEQLEAAIAALRNIGSNVASNEALAQLGNDIQSLNAKVEQLARASDSGASLAAIERRIAALTTSLENRPQPSLDTTALESAIHALADRIDRLQTESAKPNDTADGTVALAQVERRVSYLLDRLENLEAPTQNLGRVEDGLADVLRHLENQRASLAALSEIQAAPPVQPFDTSIFDTIKHELADFRLGQNEADRRTQDTLEAVHSTLGHVVDRLATIGDDLRRVQTRPPALDIAPMQLRTQQPAAPHFSDSQGSALSPHQPSIEARPAAPEFEPQPATVAAIEPYRPELPNPVTAVAARAQTRQASVSSRAPIDATLPPDYPLEPGSRQPVRSLDESDAAVTDAAPALEAGSPPNFIAAARRAAQAAAAATKEKPSRVTVLGEAARSAIKLGSAKSGTAKSGVKSPEVAAAPSTMSSKIRSLLVGASVIVIVLSGFKMTMDFLGGSGATDVSVSAPVADKAEAPAPAAREPAPQTSVPASPVPSAPALALPASPERQSLILPAPIPAAPAPAVMAAAVPSETTGSIEPATRSLATLPIQGSLAVPTLNPAGSEAIPDQLAGPALRAAAQRGEPAASYEVAVRYAEGRGVPSNYAEASRWYERAAQGGIVPAMFRLGTIMEKGLNGKKDLDTARRYYMQAAERGHAKAMHNLAVLDADGGGKGPNYKGASIWFKKAAEYGVTDSQYNLAILYARGIGVEQNLAESFKWFSLAAAQGDADAGRKRDDVAKKLDPQSLAAAKLAIQTFVPESQPADVLNVAAPAGGWDATVAAPASPAAKPKGPAQKSAPKTAIKSAVAPAPKRSASAQ